MRLFLSSIVSVLVVAACGARTELSGGESPEDASLGPSLEAAVRDGRAAPDVLATVSDAGGCEDDDNTSTPPVPCSGPASTWFAYPYTPTLTITVDRIELHTTSAKVALLASSNGAPGSVLFTGSTAMSSTPQWLAMDLSSTPVQLQPHQLYYLAEETSSCSFAGGGLTVEYTSSSPSGPWTVDGQGTFTARVHGTCGCRLC